MLTSPGSCNHCPSTKNLYSCLPSGSSRMVVKSSRLHGRNLLFLNRHNPLSTSMCRLYYRLRAASHYLLLIWIFCQLLKEPQMYTWFPPWSQWNTMGTFFPAGSLGSSSSCPFTPTSCSASGPASRGLVRKGDSWPVSSAAWGRPPEWARVARKLSSRVERINERYYRSKPSFLWPYCQVENRTLAENRCEVE